MDIYVAHLNHGSEGLTEPKFVTKELCEIQAYLRGNQDTYGTRVDVFVLNAITGEIKKYEANQ